MSSPIKQIYAEDMENNHIYLDDAKDAEGAYVALRTVATPSRFRTASKVAPSEPMPPRTLAEMSEHCLALSRAVADAHETDLASGSSSATDASSDEDVYSKIEALFREQFHRGEVARAQSPSPPKSRFWDWPLSAVENKARVSGVDKQVLLDDNYMLSQELGAGYAGF
eukprot:TRINITY_DN15812_c0_g2_i1.p1 TRINITY_DN15812_c0_g2~~TRINITY_DN15812_c0_g2_i1.p1  ORF type:complete len:191 (+),score=45.66 TRINITY_DN15812_c0_g2_i1:70-573(+)